MAIDLRYGRVRFERGTIGDKEPVFTIRARDELAETTLAQYCTAAEARGVDPAVIDRVKAANRVMAAWADKRLPD